MFSNFSSIANTPNLITNYSYHKLISEIEQHPNFRQVRLSDIFDIISGFSFKSEDYVENGIKLLRIGDIRKDGSIDYSHMVKLPNEYEYEYGKFTAKENDIVIAMTGATIGKTGIILNLEEQLLLNQRVGILRLKSTVNANVKFVYYIMKHPLFLKQVLISSMGKSQANISPYDILKIKIPYVPKEVQDEILTKIEPIEKEISSLLSNYIDPFNVINNIFFKTLDFNSEEFNDLKKQKHFTLNTTCIGNNIDLRFSFKFHNKAGEYLVDFLKKKTSKRLKDYLSEPVVLGKGISPSEYDEDGEFYYVAMSNIKNWKFEGTDCKKVKKEFYSNNISKNININDILIARSGEGTIGKVALIEDEEIEGIFADFTMRIRLKDYNPLFAYYFLCSEFFQYQVYTHKKGLGNNTNIFPSQISEFPFLDFSSDEQRNLVNKIKSVLDEQKVIEAQIKEKQKHITETIGIAISI